MKRTLAWLAVALLVAVPAMAEVPAESLMGPLGPPASTPAQQREAAADFGTPAFWSSLDSFAMAPNSNGFVAQRSSSTGLFCSSGTSTDSRAVGQVQVPHGVDLDLMRVWIFDTSATDDMTVTLQRTCLPDFGPLTPSPETLATVSSTGSGGAFSASAFLANGIVADNQSCTYQVVAQFGNTTGTCNGSMVFYKIRMQWFRLAPPQPAVASFSDVPFGSQFYREVEALVASGVTAGCATGQFCPTQFVTRLQMAAFLVRALGLASSTIPDPVNP